MDSTGRASAGATGDRGLCRAWQLLEGVPLSSSDKVLPCQVLPNAHRLRGRMRGRPGGKGAGFPSSASLGTPRRIQVVRSGRNPSPVTTGKGAPGSTLAPRGSLTVPSSCHKRAMHFLSVGSRGRSVPVRAVPGSQRAGGSEACGRGSLCQGEGPGKGPWEVDALCQLALQLAPLHSCTSFQGRYVL